MMRNIEGFDKQTSVKVFKFVLAFIVILFITFSFFNEELDCTSKLLLAREFEHEIESKSRIQKTCLLKKYLKSDISECFGRATENSKLNLRKFTFVGSKQMKDFYSAFKRKFAIENLSLTEDGKTENTLKFPNLGIQLEYRYHDLPDAHFKKLLRNWHVENSSPEVVVIGFNPFNISNENDKNIESIIADISDVSFEMDLIGEDNEVFWSIPFFGLPEMKIKSLHKYKSQIHHILKGSHVRIWDMMVVKNSLSKIGNFENDFDFDSQVLLNYLCNDRMETNSSSLCCLNKGKQKYLDFKLIIGLAAFISIVGLLVALAYIYQEDLRKAFKKLCHLGSRFFYPSSVSDDVVKVNPKGLPLSDGQIIGNENACQNYSLLLIKCVLIFSYFYICDRTNLFEKESKEFKYTSFYIPLFMASVGALAFRGKSLSTKTLNREMTDEWKGWMQIAILIYHITGASSHVIIYMHIRILVSSFLFMTGFGNFCYYWQGGELTLRRYCQVMLRMNLLTIALCIVMRKYYQFYYFVPLVSFWYTILFLFLLVPPTLVVKGPDGKTHHSNKEFFVMTIKFVVFFAIVTFLSLSKPIFDSIFLFPFSKNFFILPGHEDQEWWFRWQLDKYSVIYGAVFGLIYQRLIQFPVSDEFKEKLKSFYCLPISFLIGVGAMFSYFLLTSACFSKQECNIIHPYIVWIPILGYVLVRNITETIRGTHSILMLNAGQISLELFICQYHIWLAADTKGVLVLIPWEYPFINFFVVTIIFICVAHEVHHITVEIVNMILPKDNKRIVINLFLIGIGLFILNAVL